MRSARPAQLDCRPAAHRLRAVAVRLALPLLVAATAVGQEPAPIRVRVMLTAERPAAWAGQIGLSEGRFERLQQLSLDPSAAAAVALQDNTIRLRHRAPLTENYFDVTLRAPPGATADVRIGDPSAEPIRVPLDRLRAFEAVAAPLGEGQSIRFDRLPFASIDPRRDALLRVDTNRESLLFAPNENFDFEVLAEPLGLNAGEVFDLEVILLEGRAGRVVWAAESVRLTSLAGAPVRHAASLPAPAGEGVYTVVLRATKPVGTLRRQFPGFAPTTLAERRFQIAVFDSNAAPPKPGGWREVYFYDPRTQRLADRLPQWMLRWSQAPWFTDGPLSSEPISTRADIAAISASPRIGEAHWRAFPLPIEQPGAAYTVDVDTLGAESDRLTIAILEPDALGSLRPSGFAVTHAQPRWNREAAAKRSRLFFRPRTASPLLVIANPSRETQLRFGAIRLQQSTGEPRRDPLNERLVAIDWLEVDLPHAVGASHVASPDGRYETPDLQTYWETARGLADRVEAAGANAAIVQVNADGAAIYDSQHWRNPRFDLGAWTDGSGDLPRRELLRLIAAEFARRDLALAPAVRFDAPSNVIDAVASDAPAPGSPIYEPGSPATNAGRLAIIDEVLDLVEPYAPTPGVAVRVAPSGWGLPLRDATADEDQPKADSAEAPYVALQAAIQRGEAPKSLFVLPAGVCGRYPIARELTPRFGVTPDLTGKPGFDALLALAGAGMTASPYGGATLATSDRPSVDQDRLRRLRSVLPRGAVASYRSGRRSLRLIGSAARLTAEGAESPGDLILPLTVRDPLDEATVLAELAPTATRLVALQGAAAAGALDDSAIAQRRQFTALPLPASATESDLPDDVAAIAYDTPTGSVVSVTNQSPWPRSGQLTIETPSRARAAVIDANDSPPVGEEYRAGQHLRPMRLEPFETVAIRFDRPGVVVNGLRLEPSATASKELTAAIDRLLQHDHSRQRAVDLATNPSFETRAADASTIGWTLNGGASIDTTAAFDGAASVLLRARPDAPAEAISDPFPAPETGQLIVFLRARPGVLTDDSTLRIGVVDSAGVYRSAAPVAAASLMASEAAGPNTAWLPPIVVPFPDLPLDPGVALRIRLSLEGDGEVNLDDLRTEDLLLPRDGFSRMDLRTERFALVALRDRVQNLLGQERRLEACRRELDSYWPRFLVHHFPPRPEEPTARPDGADKEATDPTPTISQRIRGFLRL